MEQTSIRSETRRAFIADDQPDIRESLSMILRSEGFVVVGTASSEQEALDWLGQNQDGWDLAIIDLVLRTGSGFDLVRQFKASTSSGRVLVYSGFVSDVVRDQCRKLGADAAISKTDVEQLQRVLDAFRPHHPAHSA